MSKGRFRKIVYKFQTKLIRVLKQYLGQTTYLDLGIYVPSVLVSRKEVYSEVDAYSVLHPRDGIREAHAFSERYVYELVNGVIDTNSGVLYDPNRNIVVESSIWPETYHTLRLVPGVRERPTKKIFFQNPRMDALVLPSNPFYHWLIEDLPTFLYLLERNTDSNVLINRHAPNYVTNFLVEEDISFERVEDFIHVENYRIVGKREDVGWPSMKDVSILRSYFSNQFSKQEPSNAIYISRLNSTRSPSFEAGLQNELEALGIKTLFLENMSLREQISVFSGASVAIGLHGAGLSGAVWMRPGTELIELGPAGLRFPPVFARLATMQGLKYRRIEYKSGGHLTAKEILAPR